MDTYTDDSYVYHVLVRCILYLIQEMRYCVVQVWGTSMEYKSTLETYLVPTLTYLSTPPINARESYSSISF